MAASLDDLLTWLSVLTEDGGFHAELPEMAGLDRPTLLSLTEELIDRGWVDAIQNVGDDRLLSARDLRVLDAGHSALARLAQPPATSAAEGQPGLEASHLPALERLLRDTLRLVLENQFGSGWVTTRSSQVTQAMARAADQARTQRPGDRLRDDWDAVGFREMAGTLRSEWASVGPALSTLWQSGDEVQVDLRRLQEYRGRNLHMVGARSGRLNEEEIRRAMTRIRVGLEAIRREECKAAGKAWPYIESIHSNLDGLSRRSQAELPAPTGLRVGDRLWVEVRGVNPVGDQASLMYVAELLWIGGTHLREWSEGQLFEFDVPSTRQVLLRIRVADASDLNNADCWKLGLDVTP